MEDLIQFLWLCTKQGWDLDADDIEHILNGDFKWVKDQNTDSVTGEYFKYD